MGAVVLALYLIGAYHTKAFLELTQALDFDGDLWGDIPIRAWGAIVALGAGLWPLMTLYWAFQEIRGVLRGEA